MACRQLGVVNFEPLKPYFLELAAGAAATLPLVPGVPPLSASLDRNWSSDAGATPPTAPALVRSCHQAGCVCQSKHDAVISYTAFIRRWLCG